MADEIEAFDIQWDKYHRPRFVINFSERRSRQWTYNPDEVVETLTMFWDWADDGQDI